MGLIARAYPRERGGNRKIDVLDLCKMGLSPRTRGKLFSFALVTWLPEPIPANAGETVLKLDQQETAGAYPRERGGNPEDEVARLQREGLSPRTRGKHTAGDADMDERRPIPANAGETPPPARSGQCLRAYPRER